MRTHTTGHGQKYVFGNRAKLASNLSVVAYATCSTACLCHHKLLRDKCFTICTI